MSNFNYIFVSKALDLCIEIICYLVYSPQFLKFLISKTYSSISLGFRSLHTD